jgi:hypothetical protein
LPRTPAEKLYSACISELSFSLRFFISLSLSSIRRSCTNDANIVAAFGMYDNNQLAAMRSSHRNKALLHCGVRRVRSEPDLH